ncbi:5-(carboxyamino)imidazole ribonucleotide synthase [Rhodospirillaceae bacterium KN72]|uniref:N5-carboxyaminoimidazole ribonucleotide synthase n=1 Tax=Pacificispira spongiicola TaxID=2729598 RepID=A0A7Y0DY93_9PROT|nr:5-(carboxyamino)imidazole ribonucleotide synthase [Pacificispira spongiicola]NMM43796.1 5-(carboxyamino)imidazole ribonucleotide synthase [Pacificispira spongiicola]
MSNNPPNRTLPPGSTIGILGGGQLGRMLVLAAARLGYRCRIFEPQVDCPASHVADHLAAGYDDLAALDAFAKSVDVITLEFENVPIAAAERLAETVPVRPGAQALAVAQDRAEEKTFLSLAGIETAPWAPVASQADLEAALDKIGRPAVLKTARLGYDGKGQAGIKTDTDIDGLFDTLGGVPCVLEGFVDFDLEISVLAARGLDGQIACFEPVENIHRDHILHRTLVPAGVAADIAAKAENIARTTIAALDYIGLLAVEMFVLRDGRVLVNEMAPRPHNSGHWTIDGAATSQFEQVVRAVCGLPLGDTTRVGRCEMVNLIGSESDDWEKFLGEPGARLHLYGKAESRPGRKMGHVNYVWPEKA